MLSVRRVLAISILIALLVLGGIVWRYVRDQPVQELLTTLPPHIDLALDNLNYTQTEDGRTRWTLKADRAEYLRDSNLVQLAPVELVFFDAGAFGDLTLHANKGELQEESRQVDVRGSVVLTASTGETLTTEALGYNDQARQLSTAAPIDYRAPQMTLTGVGLLIDLEKNTMLVRKDVTMWLLPKTGEVAGEH